MARKKKERLDNTPKEINQSNHLIYVNYYLECRKIQKIKYATVAIKTISRGNYFSENTNMRKTFPTIDENKTRSHGRNKKSRRHVMTIITLKVHKATSDIKTMQEQEKNRNIPYQKHKRNWKLCNKHCKEK